MFHEIGVGQKFERQRYFEEAQHDFYRVQPAARFGKALHHARKSGEQRKRQSEGEPKAPHARGELPGPTVRGQRTGQQGTENGSCAGKRHQGQRQGHEKNTQYPADAFRRAGAVGPTAGQGQLVIAEEREGEKQEDDKKRDVEPYIGGDIVEDIRVYAVHQVERDAEQQIDQQDEKAVGRSLGNPFSPTPGTLGKEADRQRDHGENAGGQQGQQAAKETQEEDAPQAGTALDLRSVRSTIAFDLRGVGNGQPAVEPFPGRGGGAQPGSGIAALCRRTCQRLQGGRYKAERHLGRRQALRIIAGHIREGA